MTLRDHVYEYDTIVIGGSLEAIAHAFVNNLPLLYSQLKMPFRFDFLNKNTSLEVINILNEAKELKSDLFNKKIGIPKAIPFKRMLFLLSLAGLVPLADKIMAIHLEEDKILKISASNNRVIKIKYQKLVIFDDYNVHGLSEPLKRDKRKNKVVDWISVRSGTVHMFDYLLDKESDFVKEIFFYPSDRIDGNHDKKDAVAVSYLTDEQMLDMKFSDYYANFKTLNMMKEAGIRGRKNGRGYKGKIAYRSIKLETTFRECISNIKNYYDSMEFVDFNYQSFEDILRSAPAERGSVMKLDRIFDGDWKRKYS